MAHIVYCCTVFSDTLHLGSYEWLTLCIVVLYFLIHCILVPMNECLMLCIVVLYVLIHCILVPMNEWLMLCIVVLYFLIHCILVPMNGSRCVMFYCIF